MNAPASGRLGTVARTIVAAGALAVLGSLAGAAPAAAQWGYGPGWHHHRYWGPGWAYAPPPRCWIQRRRVWTPWGWRIERRRVCR